MSDGDSQEEVPPVPEAVCEVIIGGSDEENIDLPQDLDNEAIPFFITTNPIIKINPRAKKLFLFDFKVCLAFSGNMAKGSFMYEIFEKTPLKRFMDVIKRLIRTDTRFTLSYYANWNTRKVIRNDVDFVQAMITHGVFQGDQINHSSQLIVFLEMTERFPLSLMNKRITAQIFNVPAGPCYVNSNDLAHGEEYDVLRKYLLPDISAMRNIHLNYAHYILQHYGIVQNQQNRSPPPIPQRRGADTPVVSGGNLAGMHASNCHMKHQGAAQPEPPLSPIKLSIGQKKKLKKKMKLEQLKQMKEKSLQSSMDSQDSDMPPLEEIPKNENPPDFRGLRSANRRPEDDIPGPSSRYEPPPSLSQSSASSMYSNKSSIDLEVQLSMDPDKAKEQFFGGSQDILSQIIEAYKPETLEEAKNLQKAIFGSITEYSEEIAQRYAEQCARLQAERMVVPPPEVLGTPTWESESHHVLVVDSEDKRFMQDAESGMVQTSDDGEGCSSGMQTGSLEASPAKVKIHREHSDELEEGKQSTNEGSESEKQSSDDPKKLSKSQKKRASKKAKEALERDRKKNPPDFQ